MPPSITDGGALPVRTQHDYLRTDQYTGAESGSSSPHVDIERRGRLEPSGSSPASRRRERTDSAADHRGSVDQNSYTASPSSGRTRDPKVRYPREDLNTPAPTLSKSNYRREYRLIRRTRNKTESRVRGGNRKRRLEIIQLMNMKETKSATRCRTRQEQRKCKQKEKNNKKRRRQRSMACAKAAQAQRTQTKKERKNKQVIRGGTWNTRG